MHVGWCTGLSLCTFRQSIAERGTNKNGSCKLTETVFTWIIFKTWLWNRNPSIKACYRYSISFFKFLMLEIRLMLEISYSIVPRLNENFKEFKDSDKKLACASFWECILSLILLAMWILGWIVRVKLITSHLNYKLTIIVTSHCGDFYVFLFVIFRT